MKVLKKVIIILFIAITVVQISAPIIYADSHKATQKQIEEYKKMAKARREATSEVEKQMATDECVRALANSKEWQWEFGVRDYTEYIRNIISECREKNPYDLGSAAVNAVRQIRKEYPTYWDDELTRLGGFVEYTESGEEDEDDPYYDPNDRRNQYNDDFYNGRKDKPVETINFSWGGGILYWPFKVFLGIIREVLQALANGIAGQEAVTPQTVLFNKVQLVNINFFETDNTSNQYDKGKDFTIKVRNGVANWYAAMRTLAIIASVCVLLYIAIRMAISTVGEQQAKYKNMLKDWLTSFVLIFVMHYIIRLVLYGNDVIVNILAGSLKEGDELATFLSKISDSVWNWLPSTRDASQQFGESMIAILIYGITIAFLLMYIKRFIVIAFLIIISPLVTITYSIDKVGDGKSQAMNNWFKEFFWTVLVQPFHCIIYVVFVTTAIQLIQSDDTNLGSVFLAIYCMYFILQAEDIIKKIFGIKSDNVGKLSSSTAFVAGMMMKGYKTVKSRDKSDDAKTPFVQTKPSSSGNGSGTAQTAPDGGNGGPGNGGGSGSQVGGGVPDGSASGATGEVGSEGSAGTQGTSNVGSSVRASSAMNKFTGAMGTLAKKYVGFAWKSSMGIAGGALNALSSGLSFDSVITGYWAGSRFAEGIGEKLVGGTKNVSDNFRMKNNVRNAVDTSYDRYYRSSGKTAEEISNVARKMVLKDFKVECKNSVEEGLRDALQNFVAMRELLGSSPEEAKLAALNIIDSKEKLEAYKDAYQQPTAQEDEEQEEKPKKKNKRKKKKKK